MSPERQFETEYRTVLGTGSGVSPGQAGLYLSQFLARVLFSCSVLLDFQLILTLRVCIGANLTEH